MTSYIYNMVDTWASGGGPYTSIKMNATDNDTGSASLLMDLGTGGGTFVSRFKVDKNGIATGASFRVGTSIGIAVNTGSDVNLTPLGQFSWGSSTALSSADTILTRRGTANLRLGAADVGATTSTVTITIAAPGVVTWSGHGLSTGTPVVFTTTGALPTGITSGTTYYAVAVDANTFQLATSVANAIAATPTVITTSGSQSGTHTGTRYNITQRLSMQSITGVTDRLGADLFIQGSQGTGTGAGGSIIFQVAPAGSSGSAQNALATALTINPAGTVSIGGLTINPANGGQTFVQTFGITMVTSNAFVIQHGNGDGIDVKPLSSGSPNIQLKTSSNVIQAGLWGEAANTLALRNGTAAQAFRVYNTWTSFGSGTEIWERGNIFWDSNVLKIGTEKGANGGTARALELQADGVTRLTIRSSGYVVESSNTILSGGGFVANANNLIGFDARSIIKSEANGLLTMLNSTQTDFDRLRFGGTTPSFPALKRNGTALETKLADDTAYAPHAMQYLDVTDGVTAPASATGRARIYVDTADGDLKVIFADGTVKTIVTDT